MDNNSNGNEDVAFVQRSFQMICPGPPQSYEVDLPNSEVCFNPTTLRECNLRRRQWLLANDRMLLEVVSDRSVPRGSAAVSHHARDLLGGDEVLLRRINANDAEEAQICYISAAGSSPELISLIWNPLKFLHRDKKFVLDDECFALNCYCERFAITVESVYSNKNVAFDDVDEDDDDGGRTQLARLTLDDKKNSAEGKSVYKLTEKTTFLLAPESIKKVVTLKNFVGMEELIRKLVFQVKNFFIRKYDFYYRGRILSGLPGVGKATLVRAMARHLNIPLLEPDIHEFISDDENVYGQKLRSYRDSLPDYPCIVLFKDIDKFCPRLTSTRRENSLFAGSEFNSFLFQLALPPRRFIFGTVRNIRRLHPYVWKPDEYVDSDPFFVDGGYSSIKFPTTADRAEILKRMKECHDVDVDMTDEELEEVANVAHGYSGGDLVRACERVEISHKVVRREELMKAVESTVPELLKDIAFEIPKVTWEDVGGQEEVKQKLKWAIQKPVEAPEKFRSPQTRGILLYGPPGNSKTMIVMALANECKLNFIHVKGSELFCKYVGESEEKVKNLFSRARAAAPCIIFFDEFDAFAPRSECLKAAFKVSERCVSLLRTEMDGILPLQNVFVIAASNMPERIDPTVIRCGRFDKKILMTIPDLEDRKKILVTSFRRSKVDDDVDLDVLAEKTEGWSCAQVSHLLNEAGVCAIEDKATPEKIFMRHFEKALSAPYRPILSKEQLKSYESYKDSKF